MGQLYKSKPNINQMFRLPGFMNFAYWEAEKAVPIWEAACPFA